MAILAEETSPLGAVLKGTIPTTFTSLIPHGVALAPTGFYLNAGDGSVTFGWNEKVGDKSNGDTVSNFVYIVNDLTPYTSTTSPVTISAPNGVPIKIAVAVIGAQGLIGAYTQPLTVTPKGQASVPMFPSLAK